MTDKYSGLTWQPFQNAKDSCTESYPIYVRWRSTTKIGTVQLCSVIEIAPKPPLLCVNRSRSPIRYDFRAGAKAIRSVVNMWPELGSTCFLLVWPHLCCAIYLHPNGKEVKWIILIWVLIFNLYPHPFLLHSFVLASIYCAWLVSDGYAASRNNLIVAFPTVATIRHRAYLEISRMPLKLEECPHRAQSLLV